MGMFDYVIWKKDDPVILEGEGKLDTVEPDEWNEGLDCTKIPHIEFQSKTLDCMMDTYTVEEDGKLYKDGDFQKDFSGPIGLTGDKRYWAWFFQGELKQVVYQNGYGPVEDDDDA